MLKNDMLTISMWIYCIFIGMLGGYLFYATHPTVALVITCAGVGSKLLEILAHEESSQSDSDGNDTVRGRR